MIHNQIKFEWPFNVIDHFFSILFSCNNLISNYIQKPFSPIDFKGKIAESRFQGQSGNDCSVFRGLRMFMSGGGSGE